MSRWLIALLLFVPFTVHAQVTRTAVTSRVPAPAFQVLVDDGGDSRIGRGGSLVDATVGRATTSTRYASGYTVESVASNALVVGVPLTSGDDGALAGSPEGVYAGPTTTFVLLQNEDLTAAGWSVTQATVTANQATAPDGTVTADLVAPSGGATNTNVRRPASATCTDAVTCTGTVWLKAATVDVGLRFQIVTNNDLTSRGFVDITVTNVWKRFVVTATGQAGDGLLKLYVGGTNTWVDGEGGVYVWRPQLYNKAFPVPLDPAVAASSVTINQDAVAYTHTVDSSQAFTASLWQQRPQSDGVQLFRLTGATDLNAQLYLYSSVTDSTVTVATNLGSTTSTFTSATHTTNTWTHFVLVWDKAGADTAYMYINGVEVGAAQSLSAHTTGSNAAVRLGSGGLAAGPPGSFMADVKIFDRAFTAAQVQQEYVNTRGRYQ